MSSIAVDRVTGKLAGVKALGAGWIARCPVHEDQHQSLTIGEGDDGRALLHCHAGCPPGAVVAALGLTLADLFPPKHNGHTASIVATYPYHAASGDLIYEVVRQFPKTFKQRRPDGQGGWIWDLKGVARVLYRLPQLQQQPDVIVVEGEKDADRVAALGLVSTCNSGGAGKWRDTYTSSLQAAGVQRVVILPDHDDAGAAHAAQVAAACHAAGIMVRVLALPGLPAKGDVSDWIAAGGAREALETLIAACPIWTPPVPSGATTETGVTLDDFHAYLPAHTYIFVPTRELWPASSVNARVDAVPPSDPPLTAAQWLDRHRPVEQMTWTPGQPLVIPDRLVSEGGWIARPGCRTFNLYRPPVPLAGDPALAGPWLDHLARIYPDDAAHLLRWLAHRVQRPADKINHALVLGGAQGIGKDTLLAPVKDAVGPWNFIEIAPAHLLGRFNGFVRSVILRINEARDLGDVDRFAFYDHCKAYLASPPDVLRVNEKHLREYAAWNVCGVILTTNHKTDGLYLPADDRRHYVAWSACTKDDFPDAYWRALWGWYTAGGHGHVAAYLAAVNLSDFDAKAPPPKTPAFWEIVNAGRASEDAEIADLIDALQHPPALTLSDLITRAPADLAEWLRDRKNRRRIPHRLEAVGYLPVRNPTAEDGLWKVDGKRHVIYGPAPMTERDRQAAAEARTGW